jgi:hypothetical protein
MPRTVSARSKAYVRRAAEAQFDCTIKIIRNVDAPFNQTTGAYEPTSTTIFEGKARIWELDDAGALVTGEATFPLRATYCSIPWNHQPVPHNDDTVVVLNTPDDPDLPGRTFRIMAVDGGGHMRATRRMHITGIVENAHFNG